MNTSIDHLPKVKQEALQRGVSIIREIGEDIEMIILFGSHARGDYRNEEDLAPDRKSGAPSDYDILIVCKYNGSAARLALWGDIQKECNGLDPHMPFRLIAHDIDYLKKRLKEIHYFFSDIVKEGRLLYDSGNYQLNVNKELAPEDRLRVGQEHFSHWFERAESFWGLYEFSVQKNDFKGAAFTLHQAAECSYKALLLVHTNYTPHNHFLIAMERERKETLPEMEEIFPCSNEAEKKRFDNFDYAYIGARYDTKFEISKDDLDYLSGRVKVLIELTEDICKKKLIA